MHRSRESTVALAGVLAAALIAGAAPATAQDAPPPASPPGCTDEVHRQFDFWLGTWDVTPAGQDEATAVNRITAEHGGCVVLEQYEHGAFTGMSINFYDAARETWHQSWMSNTGGAVYLEGGLNDDGEMVLTDRDLPVAETSGTINRVTWTPLAPGEVRQHWQQSQDGGETWSTAFDGHYRRRED